MYTPQRKYKVKSHSSPWFSAACAYLCFYQREKSSKVKLRQATNHCKRVLEAPKLAYANKTKESITSKGKSAIPPLFNGPEVLSSGSVKAKLFAENFSFSSNLDGSGMP